jgi:hypothetical protein
MRQQQSGRPETQQHLALAHVAPLLIASVALEDVLQPLEHRVVEIRGREKFPIGEIIEMESGGVLPQQEP